MHCVCMSVAIQVCKHTLIYIYIYIYIIGVGCMFLYGRVYMCKHVLYVYMCVFTSVHLCIQHCVMCICTPILY